MKKEIANLISFCLLFLLFSCHARTPKQAAQPDQTSTAQKPDSLPVPESGKIYPSLLTQSGSQSYALYLPSEYDKAKKYPAIIFLDPHACGSLPLQKYQGLADEFGFILLGSNEAKNGLGFDQINSFVSSLLTEATTRYSADPRRLTLAGFSGGAKATLVSSSSHTGLAAIVYCGAALPPGSLPGVPPALAIAGKKDMNYAEVLRYSSSLDSLRINHALVEWNGKHEWPDSAAFRYACFWAAFRSADAPQTALVTSFLAMQKKNERKNDVLSESLVLEQNIAFLKGQTDTKPFAESLTALKHSSAFIGKARSRDAELMRENQVHENYLQAFESATLAWWEQETKRLSANKNDDMSQRLLGYISLAAYSISNQNLKQNNLDAARHSLTIYRLADPENSEQPFMMACLYAKLNQPDSAVIALQLAVKLGLKDRQKVESEESFRNIVQTPAFRELLNSIHP